MREGTNVEASCFVDTSLKIVSTAVSEVASIASPNILTTFANEFSSGETEAIRVVNTSFIAAQLKRFEELFPNVVPVTGECRYFFSYSRNSLASCRRLLHHRRNVAVHYYPSCSVFNRSHPSHLIFLRHSRHQHYALNCSGRVEDRCAEIYRLYGGRSGNIAQDMRGDIFS